MNLLDFWVKRSKMEAWCCASTSNRLVHSSLQLILVVTFYTQRLQFCYSVCCPVCEIVLWDYFFFHWMNISIVKLSKAENCVLKNNYFGFKYFSVISILLYFFLWWSVNNISAFFLQCCLKSWLIHVFRSLKLTWNLHFFCAKKHCRTWRRKGNNCSIFYYMSINNLQSVVYMLFRT